MDPFVRRLVERLTAPEQPLSRNRHYHTFESPEGRYALRIARRLKALQRDILACRAEGGAASIQRIAQGEDVRVEIRLERVKGRRVSTLKDAEFELLTRLEGMAEALGANLRAQALPAPTGT